MKLTKYEHSCFSVESDGKAILVDPGIFTKLLTLGNNIVAIFLTHQHGDHVNPELIKTLLEANPEAGLYGTRDTAIANTGLPITVMHSGETVARDGFEVTFYGDGQHATIHPDKPRVENLGLLINEKIFYPGDSYTKCDMPVEVLLMPTAAPWTKVGEGVDYLGEVKANVVIPTHDFILSSEGKAIYDTHLQEATEKYGGTYRRLETAESIKI